MRPRTGRARPQRMDNNRDRASPERAPRRAGPDGGRPVHSRVDRRRLDRGRIRFHRRRLSVRRGTPRGHHRHPFADRCPLRRESLRPVSTGGSGPVAAYAESLRPESDRLNVPLGEPKWEDDAYDGQIGRGRIGPGRSGQLHLRVPDFGDRRLDCITPVSRSRSLSPGRARPSWPRTTGADLLAVQGTEAGGHQGSFIDLDINRRPLLSLLGTVREVSDLPLIACGGIMSGRRRRRRHGCRSRRRAARVPRCCAHPKRGRRSRTAGLCSTGAIRRPSSPGPTAGASPADWPTASPSNTTGRHPGLPRGAPPHPAPSPGRHPGRGHQCPQPLGRDRMAPRDHRARGHHRPSGGGRRPSGRRRRALTLRSWPPAGEPSGRPQWRHATRPGDRGFDRPRPVGGVLSDAGPQPDRQGRALSALRVPRGREHVLGRPRRERSRMSNR